MEQEELELVTFAEPTCRTANVEVRDQATDEIREFLDARYVGPAEAAWRLLEFPMHGRSHSVQRLVVHRFEEQSCTFNEQDLGGAGEEEMGAGDAQSAETPRGEEWAFESCVCNSKFPGGCSSPSGVSG